MRGGKGLPDLPKPWGRRSDGVAEAGREGFPCAPRPAAPTHSAPSSGPSSSCGLTGDGVQRGPVSVRRLGTEHRRQRRSGAHSFASLSPGWLSVWVLLFLTSLAPLRLCYWKSLRPTHGGEPVRSGRQATGRLSEQAGRDSGWFAGEEGPLQSVPKGIAPVLLPQGGPAQGALVLDPTAPGRRPQEARKACTVAGPGGPAPGAMRPVLDLGDSRTQLPGGENL